MGSPPPKDAPVSGSMDAGFADSPSAPSLCGFKIPIPFIKFSLNLPSFSLPEFPPKFKLSIGIDCSLSNPVNFSAGLEWGGGRKGIFDPDPDDV